MRILSASFYIVLPAFLSSCEQPDAVSGIDPKLGRECFESHRASLPAGTQYEGIKELAEDRLTIKVMSGVKVVTMDCALQPDGTLQSTE